ncbi:hypothetical protein [Saccharothrix sp. HUAS TT1]|uniref:hypothetical protein n=1 Tax=unclassified Saccharothrix TaxID=2593673 RepID=UPI00345C4FE3
MAKLKPQDLVAGPGEMIVTRGSGNGGTRYVVGEVTRVWWWKSQHPDFTTPRQYTPIDQKKQMGYVVPIEVAQEYWSEDGLSFGVGDDRGTVYAARVRPATEEEVTAVLGPVDPEADAAAEARREEKRREQQRRILDNEIHRLIAQVEMGRPVDSEPADAPHPDAVEVEFGGPVHKGGLRLWVYEPQEGEQGALWSVKTFRPDEFFRHPLTPARKKLVDELTAAYADTGR